MKLTIDIADDTIVQLVSRYPEYSVVDTVQNLVRESVGDIKPAALRNQRYKKNVTAQKMAQELLAHVLNTFHEAQTFRALDEADKYFGSRLPHNDRGLRSSLGIHFGRACSAHHKESTSGAKAILPDTSLARGACFYVIRIS